MKVQRTPLILLLLALLLGLGVAVYETQVSPKQEQAQAKTEQLFSFKEEDVQTLSVTTPAQTVSFVKTPAGRLDAKQKTNSPALANATVWMMVAPTQTYADEASVAYLLNLMATGKRQQTLTVPASKRAEFGFDQPQAIAEVKLNNQQTHRLVLGKPNFDRSALYAQVDPPTDPAKDLSILLVSNDFGNAVNRPLAEWQMKQDKPKTK
jgi:hypothetical protein